MMIEIMPSVFPLAQDGKLNGLAVTTAKRWPLAPDIPTVAESAVPGFEVTAWDGLWAPRGTPKAVIEVWNAAARKALADPDLRQALLKAGAEPAPTTPEEFGRFIAAELPRWGKAGEQSGTKIE
jgi:tripartite-type tricarboxylate transporter receptor subunit TctC